MITSWIDWQGTDPKDPMDLIANAKLQAVTGSYLNSTTFNTAATWYDSPFSLNANPVCVALETDNLQMVADAAQWNFNHLTRNSDSTLAPPLRKVIFLRGGTQWQNDIQINLGGATYTDIQVSFRDNAGTRGDMSGTVPVISFTNSVTGTVTFSVTLRSFGRAVMGIRGIDNAGKSTMYESEWIIVP